MSVFPQFNLEAIYEMTVPQLRLWYHLAAKRIKEQSELTGYALAKAFSGS